MNCELCQDSGLEPIFEHNSFPAHAPAQKHVEVERFDFDQWPRRWEEDGKVHELLEAYRVCSCPAGQQRLTAASERKAGATKGSGWQPKRGVA